MDRIRSLFVAIVLGTIGRNLDTLIDFLNRLDDRIDAYVAEQSLRSAELELAVVRLRAEQAKLASNAAVASRLKRSSGQVDA